MKTLEFTNIYNYNTLETGVTVPVKIHSGSQFVEFNAKIDTGSTHCIFERKHGERLGIDVESGAFERFGTAVGGFSAFGHEVTISVLGIETFSTVYFAADEYFTRNILGREGWLDRVKLGLIDYEGKLFIAPYNE